MHLAKRLTHITLVGMRAGAMLRETRRQHYGPIDAANHLERRDRAGIARQSITTVRPMLRSQEAAFAQFLENLRKQRQWNTVCFGDLLGAGPLPAIDGEVL